MECVMECLKSKEQEWMKAVTEVITKQETDLAVLNKDVKDKEELISKQEQEISLLKEKVLEIEQSLNEERQKRKEERMVYEKELERGKQEMATTIDKERIMVKFQIDELKSKHASTIKEMARGMKRELDELELQLDIEKSHSDKKILGNKKLLNVFIKYMEVLDIIRKKLNHSKERIESFKSTLDQTICEKKLLVDKLKIIMEKNKILMNENSNLKDKNTLNSKDIVVKLENMVKMINVNKEKEVVILNKLEKFADVQLDLASKQCNFSSIGVQTEEMLQAQVECIRQEMVDTNNQNEILKEVIKSMKRNQDYKMQQIKEDEAQVKRLEEKVKTLKEGSIKNSSDDIWVVLKRFKEELSVLKESNCLRTTKHNNGFR